jgi:quercetin dioxygenase-like cupin family protein
MSEGGIVHVTAEAADVLTPEPGMLRQVLAYSPKMMLVRHRLSKGWVGVSHKHPHEQLVYVVSGRIEFIGGGKTYHLCRGDSIVVEGNVEHQAMALENSEVLDVFAPCRSDYAQ